MQGLQGDTVRKEPVAIVDVTGSMNEPAAPGSTISKRVLTTQVIQLLVTSLASADTQGADEEGGGGLLTFTFADGVATEVGDLNPGNFETKWHTVKWGGGTYITPALDMAMENFNEEFGRLPVNVQPKLVAAILTDGALSDLSSATAWLRSAQGNVYAYVLLLGFGHDHDKALAQWQNIQERNPHVMVESVEASTNAQEIANRILAMVQ